MREAADHLRRDALDNLFVGQQVQDVAAGRVGPDDAVEPPVVALEKLINALGNTVFYSFAVLILVFQILVWINGLLGDRRGLLWTGLAILFALVARPLMGWFAESAMDLFEKARKGELFKPVFQPLRSEARAAAALNLPHIAVVHDVSSR